MELSLDFLTNFLKTYVPWITDTNVQMLALLIIGIICFGVMIIQWYIIADFDKMTHG